MAHFEFLPTNNDKFLKKKKSKIKRKHCLSKTQKQIKKYFSYFLEQNILISS